MIIDISFEENYSVEEMLDSTIDFCKIDYQPMNNQYIGIQSMFFSITPGNIHICSFLETESQIEFIRNYIRSLFHNKNTTIGISSIGYKDDFLNIPDVGIIDITPSINMEDV